MDRSLYLQSITANHTESSENAFLDFWERVSRYEKIIGKQLEEGYTAAEYTKLLSLLKTVNLNTFYANKSRIAGYLRWLSGQGLLDQRHLDAFHAIRFQEILPEQIFETRYFGSFDSLHQAIETTLRSAAKEDPHVYDLQIAAIYLAWCGIPIEDAINLKKTALLSESIQLGSRALVPEPQIMAHLCRYRDSEGYITRGKGLIHRKYPHSEFLLRTAGSHRVEDPRQLRVYIRTFGLSGGEENIFNYDRIYWSGIFSRACTYEEKFGKLRATDLPLMEAVFQEHYSSSPAAYKRLLEYQKYRDYFHSPIG